MDRKRKDEIVTGYDLGWIDCLREMADDRGLIHYGNDYEPLEKLSARRTELSTYKTAYQDIIDEVRRNVN